MKILPISKASVNSMRQNEKAKETIVLPKSVDAKQTFKNPTFKNCGANQAAILAGCSTFGIT